MKKLYEVKNFLEENNLLDGYQEAFNPNFLMNISGILNVNDTVFWDKIVVIDNNTSGAPWALSSIFIAQKGMCNPAFSNMVQYVPHAIFYVHDIGYALHRLGLFLKE
ncbi:MAG: hypothetical protein R3Y43_02000 [Alphaproteobacteria bacterium]